MLRQRAEREDDWAIDRLLSRPVLSDQAAPYYAALQLLSRDRPIESLSMGLAGGLSLPRPVPRDSIRLEGDRLGYEGEGLEDFVEIVTRIDDFHVEVAVKHASDDAKRAAARSKKR